MSCTFVGPYENDLKKRSGNDLVKGTVNSYLRRRHYMETDYFRKSDIVLSRSCNQMTVAASVDKDASRLNSIIFSTINNDISLAEQQFTKFKSWITELPEGICQYELQDMLFPLLCHLYLEILRGGLDRQATSKFLKRHQELLLGHESFREIIKELSLVFTTQDIDSKPLIKSFRSCKYKMKISAITMAALKRYLVKHSHVILLQVLQTWFDIEVQSSNSTLEIEEETLDVVSDENADYLESLYQRQDDKEMRQLQEAIRLVRSSPTPTPPLLLYALNHTDGVCCAKISRHGKLLATGYSSSTIKLWSLSESKINPAATHYATVDLATNTPPQVYVIQEQKYSCLRGHSKSVNGVEYLYSAEVLLSVSSDCTMRAWRLADYSPASIYRSHNYPVWCVAASSLGVYIATGSHDRTARLWNLDRTYPLRIFAGHCLDVTCVQFHPNSSYVATGSADRSIRMWSVTDGSLVRVYNNGSGIVLALAFSPNGQHLASAGDDRRVKVWDLASAGLLAELKGHLSPIIALDWSTDSNMLASMSLDGTVLVWNFLLHFKPPVSESTENPIKYSTNCSTLLNLQCLLRGNFVAVGAV